MVARKVAIFSAVIALVGVIVGIGIGYAIGFNPSSLPKEDLAASIKIMDEIKAENIEENLKILTENPHIAGRKVNEEDLVNFIKTRWEDSEISVEIHPYEVLLSYPNQTDSNYLAIRTSNGSLVDKSHPNEKILDPSQDKPGVVNPFNAYSSSGDPEGDLVYVNYGTIDDFIFINEKVNLTDKICIARYGSIFRGDKALHAEMYKCSGLILYSDPADYAMANASVYPDSWYLPGTGAQRGTLMISEGDPLTVDYPSIDTAWRRKENDASLPKIPVTPIGYADAIMYLEKMGGDEVPPSWRGGLKITYRYGPGFVGKHANSKMKMHVTTKNQKAVIRNVIGYIRGYEEPDRYVIIGNHRDAWVFGAMDPSSGTSGLLEISRAYGEAVKNGWRPRRTIVFCSWGGEEYGLIGSTEWVEEFQKVLTARTVAYVNTDTMVAGSYVLRGRGMPILNQALYDAAKLVPNPNQDEVKSGRPTVYDTFGYRSPGPDGKPKVSIPGSGSDFTMFLQLVGISIIDASYVFDMKERISWYPVYHSVYETFDYVKTFVDPEFKYHQATARVLAQLARRLVDSPILPLSVVDYATKMTSDMEYFLENYGEELSSHDIDINIFRDAMSNFTVAARLFHQDIENIDLTNALDLRLVNDKLMQLDRAFIDRKGITGRGQFSHVIYTSSKHNTYGGSAFPGLVDSMFEISKDPDQDGRWDEVRRQYSILIFYIGSAASTLRDVVPIKGYSNG